MIGWLVVGLGLMFQAPLLTLKVAPSFGFPPLTIGVAVRTDSTLRGEECLVVVDKVDGVVVSSSCWNSDTSPRVVMRSVTISEVGQYEVWAEMRPTLTIHSPHVIVEVKEK